MPMDRIMDMVLGGGPKPGDAMRYCAIVLKVVLAQEGKSAQDEHSTLALAEAFAFFTDNPDLCAYMAVYGTDTDRQVGRYITKAMAEIQGSASPEEWAEVLAEGRAAKLRVFNVESATYEPRAQASTPATTPEPEAP